MTEPRQGWECPKCRKVHAPWVAGCDCHNARSIGGSTDGPWRPTADDQTSAGRNDFWPEPSTSALNVALGATGRGFDSAGNEIPFTFTSGES